MGEVTLRAARIGYTVSTNQISLSWVVPAPQVEDAPQIPARESKDRLC